MEESEKKSVLSDLYAIRASMSLIADNDDKTQAEYQRIKTLNNLADELNRKINELENSRQKNLSYYKVQTAIKDLEYKRKSLLTQKSQLSNKYNDYMYKSKHAVRNSLSEMYDFLSETGGDKGGFFSFLGGLLLALLVFCPYVLFGPIVYIIIGIKEKISYKKDAAQYKIAIPKVNKQIKEINSQITYFKNRLKNNLIYLDGTETQVKVINDSKDAEIDEVEEKIEKLEDDISATNERISLIVKSSEQIANAAAEAYPIINKNDWINVDLMIFYFETGRAESIKEALQLVDKQRQTEQLSTAIAYATQTLCKTVSFTIQSLGQTMESSFNKLSNSVTKLNIGIDESLKNYSQDRLKGEEMTLALLNKISVSSDKLSEQMDRQMREVYNLP